MIVWRLSGVYWEAMNFQNVNFFRADATVPYFRSNKSLIYKLLLKVILNCSIGLYDTTDSEAIVYNTSGQEQINFGTGKFPN